MTEQEALAVALAEQELVKPVNDIFMIDPETRTINVPDSERLFGVQSDEKAASSCCSHCEILVLVRRDSPVEVWIHTSESLDSR